jgi:FkbM family methyltransferase
MKVGKNFNFNKELSNFTSYAEFFEDLILFCIFYDVKNGFYIDVGANSPNYGSVTKALYLRGWYGINIEPLPTQYQHLVHYRKRDINLQVGLGQIEGNKIFYQLRGGSTLHKQYVKGKKANITKIRVTTMSKICRKYIPKNEVIQFCKIDVEGGEKDVLLGNNFKKYRPKVFCIESTKPYTNFMHAEIFK